MAPRNVRVQGIAMDSFSTCELSVDDDRFGALPELVSSVLSLLDIARQEALTDPALARTSLDRAFVLLQEQIELHRTGARLGVQIGRAHV